MLHSSVPITDISVTKCVQNKYKHVYPFIVHYSLPFQCDAINESEHVISSFDISTENICYGVKYRMTKKSYNQFPEIYSICLRKHFKIIH